MELQIEDMQETTVNAEVIRCGFCAVKAPKVAYSIGRYQLFCRGCAARGPIQQTWEGAVAMWNRVMSAISETQAIENFKKRTE